MNPFRHLLRASGAHPPLGTWLSAASPIIAEAMGCAGFDWALVDMEHAPLDVMDVVRMLQAVAATRMVPVVRVPWNDPVTVKRALDAGAATLMFPFVQSAEEARRAVSATRYPPHGVRGIAGMSRASRYGTQPNYLKNAHREVGVIVQLESPQALDQLEAIAQVDGVDALFVGTSDLSAAMGHLGEPAHPDVLRVLTAAVQRAKAVGVPVGTLGSTPELVAQYRAAGFDYVAVSSDLGFMMRGAQAALAALRTADAEHVHTLASGTRRDAQDGALAGGDPV